MAQTLDLIVVGAGPGGYIAAIRAAQLGMKVACVDENAALGGTCLRVGCIPSKALLESSELLVEARDHASAHGIQTGRVKLDLDAMMKRKNKVVATLTRGVAALFKKNGVESIKGRGRLVSAKDGEVTLEISEGRGKTAKNTTLTAKRVILAPGTRPATLPGIELDGDRIGSNVEALSWSSVPKRLIVIGAGYIGLELGSVWNRLGSEVIVLEYLDRILPGADAEMARSAQKIFESQGIEFRLGTRVTGAVLSGKTKVKVEAEGSEPLVADRLLVAVGRVPATSDLGLDEVGVVVDARGTIEVDSDYRTAAPGVYAIGDAIGGPQLAHKAEEEGVACVEKIALGYGHVNYAAIPGVCYTHPELAAVGPSEEQLEADGVPYRQGKFPFRANGRARALGELEGMVKMLVHEETDRILAVHILGARAGDMIAEAVAAIEFQATAEDLYRTSHAHPTLAECLKEAALATAGRTLNL